MHILRAGIGPALVLVALLLVRSGGTIPAQGASGIYGGRIISFAINGNGAPAPIIGGLLTSRGCPVERVSAGLS